MSEIFDKINKIKFYKIKYFWKDHDVDIIFGTLLTIEIICGAIKIIFAFN